MNRQRHPDEDSFQTTFETPGDRSWIARAWDDFHWVEEFSCYLTSAALHAELQKGYLKDAGCTWDVLSRYEEIFFFSFI